MLFFIETPSCRFFLRDKIIATTVSLIIILNLTHLGYVFFKMPYHIDLAVLRYSVTLGVDFIGSPYRILIIFFLSFFITLTNIILAYILYIRTKLLSHFLMIITMLVSILLFMFSILVVYVNS